MSVKTITVQTTSRTALLEFTMEAIETDGMQFTNTGREFLIVKNIDTTDTVVTAEGQTPCELGVIHDAGPITVANGKTVIFGPFNPSYYNDANNMVQLTITGTEVSGGTIAVIKLAP